MINRIELIFANQIQQVRKFKGRNTGLLQEYRDPRDEVVDIRNMREHIVGNDKVGLLPLPGQFGREFLAKKCFDDVKSFLPRSRCRAFCRLNAVTWNAAFTHILQQIAVVRANLCNETIAVRGRTARSWWRRNFGRDRARSSKPS